MGQISRKLIAIYPIGWVVKKTWDMTRSDDGRGSLLTTQQPLMSEEEANSVKCPTIDNIRDEA
jgi:hypothetical protein